MAKTLVIYYSAYGHIERMAHAVAEGVRSVAGSEVTIKRVPELWCGKTRCGRTPRVLCIEDGPQRQGRASFLCHWKWRRADTLQSEADRVVRVHRRTSASAQSEWQLPRGVTDCSGSVVATAPGEVEFGQYRILDGSGVDLHHVRRRGAETDTSPTARRVHLHLDSQVAHACFAQ
jgi:hypothetical protein